MQTLLLRDRPRARQGCPASPGRLLGGGDFKQRLERQMLWFTERLLSLGTFRSVAA